MKPFDREANLFELPTVVCYCVGQGASRCAPCRKRQDSRVIPISIGAFFAGVAAHTLPQAPQPNSPPSPPSLPTVARMKLVAGNLCPNCFSGQLAPHQISKRLICGNCLWGEGDRYSLTSTGQPI